GQDRIDLLAQADRENGRASHAPLLTKLLVRHPETDLLVANEALGASRHAGEALDAPGGQARGPRADGVIANRNRVHNGGPSSEGPLRIRLRKDSGAPRFSHCYSNRPSASWSPQLLCGHLFMKSHG